MVDKIFTILLLSLCLFSCKREISLKTEQIKGQEVELEEAFVGKYLLGISDSVFFIGQIKKDILCESYLIKNHKLLKNLNLLSRGNGPFDLMAPFYALSPNYISFCDFSQKGKMLRIHKDSIKNYYHSALESIKLPIEMGISPTSHINMYVWLNDETFMYLGGSINDMNVLSVVDTHKQKIFSCSMWFEDSHKGENLVKQGAYIVNAHIYKHPSKPIYVYACGNGQYLETFTLNSEYKVKDRKVILNKKPIYESTTDGLNYRIKDIDIHNPQGIKFVVPTEKYLYVMPNRSIYDKQRNLATYKGYSSFHNDTFEVFDWEGNHIKNIELELPCYDLGWDSKNNTLYTLTEAEDSDIMMKYNLE